MKTIKMKISTSVAVDGINIEFFKKDNVYSVSDKNADVLINTLKAAIETEPVIEKETEPVIEKKIEEPNDEDLLDKEEKKMDSEAYENKDAGKKKDKKKDKKNK